MNHKLFNACWAAILIASCGESTVNKPPPKPTINCPGENLTVCDLKVDGGANQPVLEDNIVLNNVLVTTPTMAMSKTPEGEVTLGGFFVQDQVTTDALKGKYSGVLVNYLLSANLDLPLAGDVINIEGVYQSFGRDGYPAQMQVRATFITKTSQAQVNAVDVASASAISTSGEDAEAYEGVLVRVANVVVSELTPKTSGGGEIFGAFRVDQTLIVSPPQEWAPYYAKLQEEFTSITGVLRLGTSSFNSGEYMLTPRMDSDYVPKNPTTYIESIVTIQDPNAQGRPQFCNEASPQGTACPAVKFKNVVVTAAGGYVSSNLRSVFVQDDTVSDGRYSGIKITYNKNSSDFIPEIGDRVDVTGEANIYYGSMQVRYPEFTISTTSSTALQPIVVPSSAIPRSDSGDNPYEGVLVRIENVTVTSACELATNGQDFGAWVVTGDVYVGGDYTYDYNGNKPQGADCGAGECDCAHRENNQRVVNDTFVSITGVVDFGYDDLRLQPRNNADLVQ